VSTPVRTSAISSTLFAHLDFVLTGVVMTLLGPMLPSLAARWLLNDARTGDLFIAQFMASMLGMALSGVAVQRLGYRTTLLLGLILMAAGVAGFAPAGWIFGLACVCIYSLGYGVTTPTCNLLAVEANPLRRAAALNLLNASWGIGAMGCPVLFAVAQKAGHAALFLYGAAVVAVVLAILLLSIHFPADVRSESATLVANARPVKVKVHFVALFAGLFFVYVGIETCVGGWVASFAHRIVPESLSFWTLTPSFFWGALLAGRLLAPLALQRTNETRVAAGGILLAAAGIVVLLAANGMPRVVLGATLAGLGLASVYPISISLFTQWLGEATTRTSGIVFSLGNTGGAVLPWLLGAVSTRWGSLRIGFVVPLIAAALLLVFYLPQAWPSPKIAAAPPGSPEGA